MRWVFEHRVVGGERENGTAEPGWRTGSTMPPATEAGFFAGLGCQPKSGSRRPVVM